MFEKYDSSDEDNRDLSDIPLAQLIVISNTSSCYLVWRTINTLACLTSSYMYALMAAYPSAAVNE